MKKTYTGTISTISFIPNAKWDDIPDKGKTYSFCLMEVNELAFTGWKLTPLHTEEEIEKLLPCNVLIDHTEQELGLFNTERFWVERNKVSTDHENFIIIQAIAA